VGQGPLDHRRLHDHGNDLQRAAAVRIMLQVDLEDPPATVVRLLRAVRHHPGTQPGVGHQHPMEADQVQPRPRHQRSQPLHELQRRHHQVRGAVAPGGLQPQHHLPGRVALHALVGRGRAGDVAAQLLQLAALVGIASQRGVQAETLLLGAQRASQ